MEEFSQLGGNPWWGLASASKATTATGATTASVVANPSSPSIYGKYHSSGPHLRSKLAEASSSQYPFGRRGGQAQDQAQIAPTPRDVDALKAKIISHPQYSSLISAFVDCQKALFYPILKQRKVGAPPEVAAGLSATAGELEARQRAAITFHDMPTDPELDQFMEAYYNMLLKYREELARPLQEAMEFLRRSESQLNSLSPADGSHRILSSDGKHGVCSSEEDQEGSGGENETLEIEAGADDRGLKQHLLKKYRGYLSSLRQELSKKKKKGKLPREARQKLLSWWELHCKWPYPSEAQKVSLAESTGLDLKQINNWFINQRKRHWKPSEDMQFVVMNGYHLQNAASLYMDGHFMGEGLYHPGP